MSRRWKPLYTGPKQSPCLGCKDRSPSCHGSCRLYAEYQQLCQNMRKQRMLRREVECAICDAKKRMPGEREV